MRRQRKIGAVLILCCLGIVFLGLKAAPAAQPEAAEAIEFPRSLDSYEDSDMGGIGTILINRIAQEPFNLFATLIFVLAIVHTFMASRYLAIAHRWEKAHAEKIKAGQAEPYSIHLGATVLTAFNDNAAITFLATLVPDSTNNFRHAVVAGAITSGGLTFIANAPDPVGVSILKKYFTNGVGAGGLFLAALAPTAVVFMLLLIFG